MRAVDILLKKKHGLELERDEIAFLVDGFTAGSVPDYQMSAFLMAVTLNGMTTLETRALTESMLASGTILDLSDIAGTKVDKHSTGGVGDKTSLIIAPLAAAAGVRVPMISGRALAHSGGTLDKLESIPGFDVRLDEQRFKNLVATLGCAIVGQTDDIAPADRKLYALRDVTGTVSSLPLITASILSKKLAEGITGLVLDVKCGSGAFMKSVGDARALASSLIDTASDLGTTATALLTDMNQPLGNYIGNALEVEESIAVLRGEGPRDLIELSLELTAHMLVLGDVAESLDDGRVQASRALDSGQGLEKFEQLVRAQGGDLSALPHAERTEAAKSRRAGYVSTIETESVGRAAMVLGAGRRTMNDVIDPAAGIVVHEKLGDSVEAGAPLVTFHFNDERNLQEAMEIVDRAYEITDTPPATRPLVHEVMSSRERST